MNSMLFLLSCRHTVPFLPK